MIEAMARGLPLVVAATPENIEMTQDAALRFSPMDANALADQLANLMDDDGERVKRGQLSLARSRDFSWEKSARQTILAFERAATKPVSSTADAFAPNHGSLKLPHPSFHAGGEN